MNYVLRGGDLFNMVLLVPDDIPEESLASTIEGNVEEMCALFKGWDPRLVKPLALLHYYCISELCSYIMVELKSCSSFVSPYKSGACVFDSEASIGLIHRVPGLC